MNHRVPMAGLVGIALFCTLEVAVADEAEKLVEALKLEERWSQRIVGPATERLLARTDDILRKTHSDSERASIVEESRQIVNAGLSWESVGKPTALAQYRICDDRLLIALRQLTLGQQPDPPIDEETFGKIESCKNNAESAITDRLQDAMGAIWPKLDEVVLRYPPSKR